MNKQAAVDQLRTLISTYNDVFHMCYDALAAETPQIQRDALRVSIEDFIGTKESSHSQGAPFDQLDKVINSYSNQFQLCYAALAEDTPQAKRDDLRNAIAGFLDKK